MMKSTLSCRIVLTSLVTPFLSVAAATFHCESNIPAYDLKDSSNKIGEFFQHSEFEVDNPGEETDGFVRVKYKNQSGTTIEALCKKSDLKEGTNPKNPAADLPIGLEIGKRALEIIEQSASGGLLKLSSFQGSMVLVDFWASWCSPCRAENPNVVAAYIKYHGRSFKGGTVKGFNIFSVSLDEDRSAWKEAILSDKLIWKSHVSDLGGWKSRSAVKYGVRSIPTNFLLDENGVIIKKGLRGASLEAELEKLSHESH